MEDALATVLHYLIPFVEACGALVIILGVLRAIVLYLGAFFLLSQSGSSLCAFAWAKAW